MNHSPPLLLPKVPPRLFSLAALRSLLAVWQARVRLRHQLATMAKANPHLIDDIGLSRRQVAAEIAKPFWRG